MSTTTQLNRSGVAAIDDSELRGRGDALRTAVTASAGILPDADLEAARKALDKVGQRTAIGGSHTVVALAGATGSGKSSLFNALAAEPVSRIGARRPTTSRPTAAVWGQDPAGPLLDWLGVAARHQVPADDRFAELLDGLVLLDLPDFDSRVPAHRREADRVLERADVFVWVTDPQKYADALLHDEYVRTLAARRARTLAVLNQVDRLDIDNAAACAEDLSRLLAADGIGSVEVVQTSAVDGRGVDDLAARIGAVVQEHNAAERRLVGDLASAATRLQPLVGSAEPELSRGSSELVAALSKAAGVPAVVDAVRRDYRREASKSGGWPLTRWAARVRRSPLDRLHLQDVVSERIGRSEAKRLLGRTSLPEPTAAAKAEVDLAARHLVDEASAGLPAVWAERIADVADPRSADLRDALDQAVLATDISARRPRWWSVVSAIQWVAFAALVAGALWLLAAGVLGLLNLSIGVPRWFGVPAPFWLAGGGALVGVLTAALSRWLAGLGARRRAATINRRLGAAIDQVAQEQVLAPVREVLDTHRTVRENLARAAHE
ncbi:50S ribosome-binding GTPase [Branchiibius hedensis]|uniref:50S ribosome-binding GTPase n=1 Tax=Branchiibius hedensis TaxID=672460 RepID=A0A2Y8ZT34_9MICO|nr:GTPase [Branchiibius hedensis]PWJ24582.1 50S ribosome-binding GTPase [Branchiibius hedensis]SSA33399.1 50S ribosome-binding GTPase [Branchiibius hedensis]